MEQEEGEGGVAHLLRREVLKLVDRCWTSSRAQCGKRESRDSHLPHHARFGPLSVLPQRVHTAAACGAGVACGRTLRLRGEGKRRRIPGDPCVVLRLASRSCVRPALLRPALLSGIAGRQHCERAARSTQMRR